MNDRAKEIWRERLWYMEFNDLKEVKGMLSDTIQSRQSVQRTA